MYGRAVNGWILAGGQLKHNFGRVIAHRAMLMPPGPDFSLSHSTMQAKCRIVRLVLPSALIVVFGCSDEPQSLAGEPTPEDRQRFSGRRVPQAYPPPAPTRVRAPATGNTDNDFLRQMSDHHKDVVRMTHVAIETNRDPALHRVIRRVEEEHDHALDAMMSLLRDVFADSYAPQTNPENDQAADRMRRSVTEYRTTFLVVVEKSEDEATRILNEYLPNAKNHRVRNFAERLRREERAGMAALRRALTNQSPTTVDRSTR